MKKSVIKIFYLIFFVVYFYLKLIKYNSYFKKRQKKFNEGKHFKDMPQTLI